MTWKSSISLPYKKTLSHFSSKIKLLPSKLSISFCSSFPPLLTKNRNCVFPETSSKSLIVNLYVILSVSFPSSSVSFSVIVSQLTSSNTRISLGITPVCIDTAIGITSITSCAIKPIVDWSPLFILSIYS